MRRSALLPVVAVLALGAACVPVTPPPDPPPPPPPPPPQVKLTQVNDVPSAITMATRPGDPTLYVGSQNGLIYAVNPGDPVGARNLVIDLNAAPDLVQSGGEQGLLGMDFSADGSKLYVHYTATAAAGPAAGDTEVDEFGAIGTPATVSVASRRRVLTAPGLESNHNGGSLLFGPDGMLYLALGDGGGGQDGWNGTDYSMSTHPTGGSGQSLDTLLGKILRIDPTDPAPAGGGPGPGLSYTVPPDNPFVTTPAGSMGEIWSFGLRNPFRMSFDKSTGDLWLGDVGQAAREEIDFLAFNDAAHPYGESANFGWNRREGTTSGFDTGTPPNGAGGALVEPIFDIDRTVTSDCAIVGGYVYRGAAIAGLAGQYLYTDFCNPAIRSLTRSGATATNHDLGVSLASPGSFGEDENGELYVLSLASGLWRIDQL